MADRRVTFDRAVSREPLALAADATSYALGMVFWYFRTDLLEARRTRGGVCKARFDATAMCRSQQGHWPSAKERPLRPPREASAAPAAYLKRPYPKCPGGQTPANT
jgi:hypothetical protein